MAAFAAREILAERRFVVVAGRTVGAGLRRFMHRGRRDVHLAAGRRVTAVAVEESVFLVAEVARDRRR